MPLLPATQKFVDNFFDAIALYQSGLRHRGFSYLALKFGERYQIIRGRLFMGTAPPAARPPHFQSAHVRAGYYTLEELGTDVHGLVAQLLAGVVATPEGPLHFIAGAGGNHGASFVPFHPDGLATQTRINVLTIMGGEMETIRQPEVDWEVKSASRPYDSLQEIANEMSLGVLTQYPPQVEVVAYNVAAVDGQNSRVSGERADVQVILAKGLERDRLTLGYRVYVKGAAVARDVVRGGSMVWSVEENFDRGQTTIPVPLGGALNCAVSYDGVTQQHYWLADPGRIANPRRAVYEAFDPKLENLKAILANALGRGAEARDLESAVAWLLWMLGFSVAHLNTRTMREAADLIATTPLGHFAIVECTTGLLKAENKLSLLHDRVEAVRRGLADANNAHLHLLPVMVTSKTRTEVAPDIEAAERLGVLVMTREHLDQVINQRTLVFANADQMYLEAEQSVSAALAKYQPQEIGTANFQLPLSA
jgi:hypothetical protein